MLRRCYSCNTAEAVYEAKLDHDCTPVVLLCEGCARWEREGRSVEWGYAAGGLLRTPTEATPGPHGHTPLAGHGDPPDPLAHRHTSLRSEQRTAAADPLPVLERPHAVIVPPPSLDR